MALLRSRFFRVALPCVLLVGCLLPPAARSGHPTPFDHSVHLKDGRLQCRNCHLFDQEGRGPTLPGPLLCRVCHAKLDADKPASRRIDAFFDESARFKRSRSIAIPGEVKFSHAGHTAKLDCSECHTDMRERNDLPPLVTSKDRCMDCHQQHGLGRDCAGCHREIRVDKAPATHGLDWMRGHGATVRAECPESANRCELCHDQSASCDRCHQTKRPKDHTHHFRNRGHGLQASVDRNRCSTCHNTNTCTTCHQNTRPASHRGGWGGRQSRHCGSCHLPLKSEGCRLCHTGTPSHASATPMPASHHKAMNCRQCHGAGASLPHPDYGHSCTACHR